ncbi:MAG: glycosyltransferase family 39 protein [Phycisphaerae bacterium]|nr:glycosyltransferase family 39 protein [Phycisphaerae bacterium]
MTLDKDDQCSLPAGPESVSRKYLLAVIGFLVVLTAVRLAILASGVLNVSGDEAHYGEWSRRLDWCYYSKPPGVALMVRAGTLVFGDTELGVRFMAPVLSLLSSVVMYHLGKRLYGRKAGLIAAVLLQIVPMISAFGLGMTPDTPLIFFWLLSLYFLHRAWSSGATSDWLLLAVSLGVGLLSKYAIAFLYIPAALLLLTTRQGRLRLRTPWPYLSFALSLLFFLPVVVWNSHHDWVMFRHDLGHTAMAQGWSLSPRNFLEFVGGQLGVVTPILAVLILYLLVRRRCQDPFCFWMTIPLLIGFLLKSLQGKVQPNWPLTAWLAGLIPLADFLVHHYRPRSINQKRLVSAGLIIAAVATLFLHLPFLTLNLPWPGRSNPFRKLIGWRQLGTEVTQIAQGMNRPFVFSDYYMIASELAFYTDGHPTVYCVNLGRRMNQYDIWAGLDKLVGRDAVYVAQSEMPPDPVTAFEQAEAQPTITIHTKSGWPTKAFVAYRCRGFKGWTPKTPRHY